MKCYNCGIYDFDKCRCFTDNIVCPGCNKNLKLCDCHRVKIKCKNEVCDNTINILHWENNDKECLECLMKKHKHNIKVSHEVLHSNNPFRNVIDWLFN